MSCRECHQTTHHKLSCSHLRYEERPVVAPADEVAHPDPAPVPYCPGPDVLCTIGASPLGTCMKTRAGHCYYGPEASAL